VPDFKLAPIVVPKTSDVLANELRRQILGGAVAPGASLPAERDLVTQTGLSRGSVREALRILEAEGLVSTRPGRMGGSVARQPGDDSLAKYISLFVHGRGITLLSLLQTREAFEPSIAALAAENRTDEELQQLIAVTERVEAAYADTPLYLAENVAWHCAVANASCDVARGAEFASGLASFGANRKRSAGDQNGVFESRTSCRIPPDC